jgi:uroporphyrinogen decarboxylase
LKPATKPSTPTVPKRKHHQHLAFFRATGMDFVKIQYEQTLPPAAPMRTPADWAHAPRCDAAFFKASIRVAEGLINAAKDEALVIMTLYSPFMWAAQLAGAEALAEHLRENPDAVLRITRNGDAEAAHRATGAADGHLRQK